MSLDFSKVYSSMYYYARHFGGKTLTSFLLENSQVHYLIKNESVVSRGAIIRGRSHGNEFLDRVV